MRDFLIGTLGKFLQIILGLASIGFIFAGLLSCGAAVTTGDKVIMGVLLLVGILCGCGVFGIRYWLGHIVRIR